MTPEIFTKSVEKLASQGAVQLDMAGNVRATGVGNWRTGYEAQMSFRQGQIDRMMQFAETQQCRMTAIIKHFGDTADAHRPCGKCDFCSPSTTSAQIFAEPTTEQARNLRTILRALESRSTSTGKLHTELALGIERRAFDVLLDALARAGLITLATETFVSKEDGRTIPYKKASLTHEGRSDDASELTGVVLPATSYEPPPSSRGKRKSSSTKRKSSPDVPTSLTPTQQQLDDALRAWRKSEAAKTGKPAFIVLSDAVIRNIAISNPQSIPELPHHRRRRPQQSRPIRPGHHRHLPRQRTSQRRQPTQLNKRIRSPPQKSRHLDRSAAKWRDPRILSFAPTMNPRQPSTEPEQPQPPSPKPLSPPSSNFSTPNSAPGAKPNPSASASRNSSSSAPPPCAASSSSDRAPSPNSKPSPASAPTRPTASAPPSSKSAVHEGSHASSKPRPR